ncbi:MAG: ABC transporter permease [Planctomycetota bacterium]|nr:ABC transporter permease [Planctomycetota bacterium]
MKNRTNFGKSIWQSPQWNLATARLREFYRQPEAIFWVYFFPILLVVALGIAFRNKPLEQITVDVQRAARSSELAKALGEDPRVLAQTYDLAVCQQRLRTGKSDLYVIPGIDAYSVEYVYDPTRPGSVVAKNLTDQLIQKAAGRIDPVQVIIQEHNEPGSRYIDFLVPGLLGMGLMGGGLWGVGFAIVDMRIRKLLKRFLATPMKKSHFLMGAMASRLVFMVPEIILLVVFSWLCFDVRVYGSWFTLILLVLLGAVEFSGIGLLVASRARTLESVSGLMNLVMLPMWTLSGVFFSYDRFPEAVQPLIRLLPLTPLIDALRKVMLEGATLNMLGPEILIMSLWAIVCFSLALKIFRWTD